MQVDMDKFHSILSKQVEFYKESAAKESNIFTRSWLLGVQTSLIEVIAALDLARNDI